MDQYTTTYQNDYLQREITCPLGAHHMRKDPDAKQGKVECKPVAYTGVAVGSSYEKPGTACPCSAGGNVLQRGATASGLPTNLNTPCTGQGGTCWQKPAGNQEDLAKLMLKAADTDNIRPEYAPQQDGRFQKTEGMQCPPQEPFRPIPAGQFGGQYEGAVNRQAPEYVEVTIEDMGTFPAGKPCMCPPGKPESGPQDYGPAWIRDRAAGPAIEPRMTGGTGMQVSPDVARLINPEAPAARVSCAPESDIAKFDQPNSFMKKLYDKYPYLYQILRDTPPEELISRVFKDRFMTTYQVDFLHLGAGKEATAKDGAQGTKFTSPEGEPEPDMIPGCTYRASKRGESNFGKKKSNVKSHTKKEEEEEEEIEVVKDEPRITEYMASISKLGEEIILDKLYATERKNRQAAMKSNS